LRLEDRLVGEVVAVGERLEHGVVAVLAGADLVDLAVGDQDHLVGLVALQGQHVAGLELALDEAAGQDVEDVDVLVAAEQRQLAQLERDDLDLRARVVEGDAAVADRVAQATVEPEHAVDVDPRQQLEQPARRDPLHLRRRLGRGGQLARCRGAEARLLLITTGLTCVRHDDPFTDSGLSYLVICAGRLARRQCAPVPGSPAQWALEWPMEFGVTNEASELPLRSCRASYSATPTLVKPQLALGPPRAADDIRVRF
jgi:hypothetical protein